MTNGKKKGKRMERKETEKQERLTKVPFPSLLSVSFCFCLLFSALGISPAAWGQGAAAGASSGIQEPILELQPLVITAPRLKYPSNIMINPLIDMNLLRLLSEHENERPNATAQLDPNLTILTKLTTLDGYNLQTRYSQLGFLLTQGLAGAKDLQVQQALVQAAQKGINDQIQASAMIALAYTKDPQFIGLFMSALQNSNITIRFAGIESLLIVGGNQAEAALSNDAQTDSSLIAQAYAAAKIWGLGDVAGKNIILNLYQNPDWLIRAIAYHYMGQLGGSYEYTMLLSQLPAETNPIAQAELCAALLRLGKYRNN